jgi:2TM domain
MQNTPPLSEPLERLARRRAGMKMGWLIHASVFAVVNLALLIAQGGVGRGWLGLPTGGWIIGLVAHGALVLMHPVGLGVRTWLIEQERRRLHNRP